MREIFQNLTAYAVAQRLSALTPRGSSPRQGTLLHNSVLGEQSAYAIPATGGGCATDGVGRIGLRCRRDSVQTIKIKTRT